VAIAFRCASHTGHGDASQLTVFSSCANQASHPATAAHGGSVSWKTHGTWPSNIDRAAVRDSGVLTGVVMTGIYRPAAGSGVTAQAA